MVRFDPLLKKIILTGTTVVLFFLMSESANAAIGCDCKLRARDRVNTADKCQVDGNPIFKMEQMYTVNNVLDKTSFDKSCDWYGTVSGNQALFTKNVNSSDQDCTFEHKIVNEQYEFSLVCSTITMDEPGANPPKPPSLPAPAVPQPATNEEKTQTAPKPQKKPAPDSAAEAAAIAGAKSKTEGEVKGTFDQLQTTDPKELIARFIKGALGIVGSLSLVMFIYGGVLWMTAHGDSSQNEKAGSIIVWTSLGLAVIFASYALVDFILEAFR